MNSDGLGRLFARIHSRLSSMLRRAVISMIVDKNAVQTVQLKVMQCETRNEVERMQDYGVSTVPVEGCEALAAFLDGECGHVMVIATNDRRCRPRDQPPGSVMIYTVANRKDDCDTEHHVFMDPEGRVTRIRAKDLVIDVDGDIDMKAKGKITMAAGDDITVNGKNVWIN